MMYKNTMCIILFIFLFGTAILYHIAAPDRYFSSARDFAPDSRH